MVVDGDVHHHGVQVCHILRHHSLKPMLGGLLQLSLVGELFAANNTLDLNEKVFNWVKEW